MGVDKIFSILKGIKFRFYGASKFPRLRGACYIRGKGKVKIGKNFSVIGRPVPVTISTENNEAKLLIGDNVFLNYGVDIGCKSNIIIGDHVKVGPMTNIIDSNYHKVDSNDHSVSSKIEIGNNVWIGRNCIILPGVKIGDNSVIASGSIVTKNVEKNILVGGNPAKIIRNLKIDDGWVRD